MKQEARRVMRVRRMCFGLLSSLVLLLAGCGQGQQAGTLASSAPSAAQQAAATPVPSASQQVVAAPSASATPAVSPTVGPTATPTLGPDEFRNPVIDQDFPDPDVLKVGDTYYAYATNNGATRINIQLAKSTDLVNWTMLPDALPQPPTWTVLNFGFIWAPEVTTWDDGKTYVMYYTARDQAADKQCIGVATSTSPEGPFKDNSDKPFICQADIGGSIDASSFQDEDGSQYVLWKNDGNCCGYDTFLHIQRVSADGLTLEGEPTQLLKQDQAWEGNLVEAPTLWKHNAKYYLFYSANNYAGADYATGYAIADAATGPYTKPISDPFMETDFQNGGAIGPGGQDIVVDDDGETWIMYHSWEGTNSYRRVQIDQLTWNGDTPVVDGPDRMPQPKP